MRVSHLLSRLALVLGLWLMTMPAPLLADSPPGTLDMGSYLDKGLRGGALKKLAEQLGLSLTRVSTEPKVGDKLILPVVNPEKLARFGLYDLRANSEVEVTILSEEQVSVAPVTRADPRMRVAADAPRLVAGLDEQGTIAESQIVRQEVTDPIHLKEGVIAVPPPTRAAPAPQR